MELQPTDFTDGVVAHRFHRSSCRGTPPPYLLCRSVESVGAVSLWADGAAAHRFHRWNCSPQILPIELQGVPSPYLLCRSVGAVSLWADGAAAHRFHRSSCRGTPPPYLLC